MDFIITKHGHLIKLPYNWWAAIICFEVGLDACSLLLAFITAGWIKWLLAAIGTRRRRLIGEHNWVLICMNYAISGS